MKKVLLKINEEGYLIFGEEKFIHESEDIPNGYIETPLPTDREGRQLGFFKPKWNGTEWIEGATQEEIEELTRVEPSQPTAEERINALEEAFLLMMMEG